MKKIILGLVLATMALLAVTAIGTYDMNKIQVNAATSMSGIVADEAKITINTSLSGSGNVKIYRTDAATEYSKTAIFEGETKIGTPLEIDRYCASYDKVYDRFHFVVNGELIKSEYVTAITPKYTYLKKEPLSIKGLQVQMIDDAAKLGISHASINYSPAIMYSSKPTNNFIEFESNGSKFYFKKDLVYAYDKQITSLYNNNIEVTLICVLWGREVTSTPAALVHPGYQGATGGQGKGEIAAFNTTTPESLAWFTAFMEFTVDRYSRPSEEFGRVMNYVIGNEIDNSYVWNNCGLVENTQEYVRQYLRALRIAHTACAKYQAEINVLVSLDHMWNISPKDAMYGGFSDVVNGQNSFRGRDLLVEMNAQSKAEGDFDWGVAYHPYPTDLSKPDFWNTDTLVATKDALTSQKITFNNIEILPAYMNTQEFKVNGRMRSVYLTEQGFNTSSNSLTAQSLQAAAYSYAYYKMIFSDGISGFILHRHVDCRDESGLNLGLWTRSDSSYSAPNSKKLIYDVFKYIDTEKSLEYTNLYINKIIINGKTTENWSELIPNFDAAKLCKNRLGEPLNIESVNSFSATDSVYSFDKDVNGFSSCDYAESVEKAKIMQPAPQTTYKGDGMLLVQGSANNDYGGASAYRSVIKKLDDPMKTDKLSKCQFAINFTDSGYEEVKSYATIFFYDGNHSAQASAQIHSGKWNLLSVDLKNIGIDKIDKIKISYNCDTNIVIDTKIYIDEVGFVKAGAADSDPSAPEKKGCKSVIKGADYSSMSLFGFAGLAMFALLNILLARRKKNN